MAAPEPAARPLGRLADAGPGVDLRPRATLALLSAQHGFIHAQTALLPLVLIAVTPAFVHTGLSDFLTERLLRTMLMKKLSRFDFNFLMN